MHDRILAFDWSSTPLGPLDSWSTELATTVEIALASRFPMILWWGPELTVLYNDAYIPIFASKHPGALGAPGLSARAWGDPDVAQVIGPMLESVRRDGQATWSEDQLLILERHGFAEETYFTWSYSPVTSRAGRVAGVFTAVFETTGTVIRARRLRLLADLMAATVDAPNEMEAARQASSVLDRFRLDLPFHAIFARRGRSMELAAGNCPELSQLADSWRGPGPVLRRLEPGLTNDVWPEPVRDVLLTPLTPAGGQDPWGLLAVGLSPRLAWEGEYSSFVELLTARVDSALGDAMALEAERRRAEALAELDRAKTAFFTNVSHEFRTPLTLMLAPLDDLLSDPGTAADQRSLLDTARSNGRRMLKLVNSLLQFARLEGGTGGTTPAPVDVAKLTANLVAQFRSSFESAGLDLELDMTGPGAPVYLDAEMWETVVLNLLSNALKYTAQGRVGVRLDYRDGRLRLEVSDTGVGIPDTELERVFDRFFRSSLDSARSAEGSGIGLALSRELVELSGGSVTVGSSVGQGSTFTVEVPAEVVAAGGASGLDGRAQGRSASMFVEEAGRWQPARPAASGPDPTDGSKPTVLVVDDNSDMRAYLQRTLSTRFNVTTAANGLQALDALRARRPAAVVSDIMMPKLDGLGLTRAIRADPELAGVPVLLLSARAGTEATVEGLEHGADDYLVKPFSSPELVSRLHNLVTAGQRSSEGTARAAHREALTAAVTRLAGSISAAATVQRCVDAVTESLSGMESFFGTTLGLLDPDGTALELTWGVPLNDSLKTRFHRIDTALDVPQNYPTRTGEPLFLPDRAALISNYPHLERDVAGLEFGGACFLPVYTGHDRIVGSLGLTWREAVVFDLDRIEFVSEVATIVGRTLERIKQNEAERTVAAALQSRLLAVDLRAARLAAATCYVPSETSMQVGGDWYDLVGLRDGRYMAAVGDVVGRGIEAAATMGQLRSALSITARQEGDPARVADLLDDYSATVPGSACTTVVLARVDPAAETVSHITVGHPPPLLVGPDGQVSFLDDTPSWPLGVRSVARPNAAVRAMPAGSLLVMYTDGLIERRGESIERGLERLRSALECLWPLPTRVIVERLLDSLGHHGSDSHDDIAVLAVRTPGQSAHHYVDVLAAGLAEIPPARARLRAWLSTVGVTGELHDDVVLSVGELLSNAVEHGAGGDSNLTVRMEVGILDDEIAAVVSDPGRWKPGMSDAVPSDRGRGFTIVEALASTMEVSREPSGTAATLSFTRGAAG